MLIEQTINQKRDWLLMERSGNKRVSKMSSPEDREKHRKRIKVRSNIAKSLEDRKFRQRKVEDKKKKVDVQKLSHRDLVQLLQEKEDNG